MNKLFAFILLLMVSGTLQAAESDRFIKKFKLSSGQTVVVAEGDFEARSIGSFTVRLYDAGEEGDDTTFFTSGQIRSRDGSIEKVVLADVVGDKQPEVIVIVRNVGSGSYLSAQAFSIDKTQLIFSVEVEDLPPDADPVAALRKSIKKGK